jgi:hypothetical protein
MGKGHNCQFCSMVAIHEQLLKRSIVTWLHSPSLSQFISDFCKYWTIDSMGESLIFYPEKGVRCWLVCSHNYCSKPAI